MGSRQSLEDKFFKFGGRVNHRFEITWLRNVYYYIGISIKINNPLLVHLIFYCWSLHSRFCRFLLRIFVPDCYQVLNCTHISYLSSLFSKKKATRHVEGLIVRIGDYVFLNDLKRFDHVGRIVDVRLPILSKSDPEIWSN